MTTHLNTPPRRHPARRGGRPLRWLIAAGLAVAVAVAWITTAHPRHDRSASISTQRVPVAHPAGRSPELVSGDAEPGATPRAAAAAPAGIPVLHDEHELDDYLGDIEARAARDPEVAVMEIEDGIEAIHRLAGQLGADRVEQKQRAFADRMGQIAMTENADVRPDEIDALAATYAQTSEARERDRLRRRYAVAFGKLGLVDRVRELGRLQRMQLAE